MVQLNALAVKNLFLFNERILILKYCKRVCCDIKLLCLVLAYKSRSLIFIANLPIKNINSNINNPTTAASIVNDNVII